MDMVAKLQDRIHDVWIRRVLHDLVEIQHTVEMGPVTDPVVYLVPVRGHLGGPGRVGPRDDGDPGDLQALSLHALDDLRHPGDQLVPRDESAGEIVGALEEDDTADPGSRKDVAVKPLHRGGAALSCGDGHPVASDALVDERLGWASARAQEQAEE